MAKDGSVDGTAAYNIVLAELIKGCSVRAGALLLYGGASWSPKGPLEGFPSSWRCGGPSSMAGVRDPLLT